MIRQEKTVYFENTDAAGVIYFADLFRIIHQVYEEWLSSQEVIIGYMEKGYSIPVFKAESQIIDQIKLWDKLTIEMFISEISQTSFVTEYNVLKNETLVAKCKLVHVLVDKAVNKKAQLTAEIKNKLRECQG